MLLSLYHSTMACSGPFLRALLWARLRAGKEDPARVRERTGKITAARPAGRLIWFHGASVGEAQATLILIDALTQSDPDAHILVTTGTKTSAALMAGRLPPNGVHQFYPLDHSAWVARFIDHWRPDAVIWMESEIWPNMIGALGRRNIPLALVNARLSPRSLKRWRMSGQAITKLLQNFRLILTQSAQDQANFQSLGAPNIIHTGNLKYAAAPLPVDNQALESLRAAIGARPFWLYASTHDGEEKLAARLHAILAQKIPGLLTIIAPRHPERRAEIEGQMRATDLNITFRGEDHILPGEETDLYIADTMGELGLFYRLAPLACIGRSFSSDGGGGHNPIEAAMLGCAVLHGPHVQNLAEIFAEMDENRAAILLEDEYGFEQTLMHLLNDERALSEARARARTFAESKIAIRDSILDALEPVLGIKGRC